MAPLRERERQVLALILQGKQNKEIAAALYLSVSTAKFHVRSVLTKYGVETKVELLCKLLREALENKGRRSQ